MKTIKTNTMKYYLYPIYFAILISCDNGKLSRSFALKTLNSSKYPDTVSIEFQKKYCKGNAFNCPHQYSNVIRKNIESLAKAGYVNIDSFTQYSLGWYSFEWMEYYVSPTDKAKQFLIQDSDTKIKFMLYSRQVKEITGIIETEVPVSRAEVRYMLEMQKEFPIYKLIYSKPPDFSYEQISTFTKFDDGWRLDKKSRF